MIISAYPSYIFNQQYLNRNQCCFQGASSRKFIEKLKEEQSLKHIKATFNDMVGAYEELGYEVIFKRGSHAVVPISKHANIPLVIPHGQKYVAPIDLKRLKLVIQGEIEKAIKA